MSTAGVKNLGSNISESPSAPVKLKAEGETMREFRDVIRETRKVALTNPLGRNVRPEYTKENGKPCCLFGHVLERLGVPVAQFELKLLNNHTLAELPWSDWGFEPPNTYQALWTTKVQAGADNGEAWIIAIAMADATPI
ncbi:hypothetical protein SEQ_HALENA_42 [Mycobacterium phage Halena]|uniref:Uncharacterized protein n=1 Tax=Mycobacterium phage Halena TaxID=2517952 RepID=A0A482JDW1_9CAUD|nr:hypothetical protein SEQ_HALENA_42 [Mycobacterium phage Halena]